MWTVTIRFQYILLFQQPSKEEKRRNSVRILLSPLIFHLTIVPALLSCLSFIFFCCFYAFELELFLCFLIETLTYPFDCSHAIEPDEAGKLLVNRILHFCFYICFFLF
ncbi:hypothetical protein NMG60_11014049 [Bertholletia excelsa]